MTSIIKLTPLSGGGGGGGTTGSDAGSVGSQQQPHCYLLEVDTFTFLLDCGWDGAFTSPYVNTDLRRAVSKVDAVLLSYPDTLHLGALPHAVGRLGLSCPVYATVPVYKMGQMFMYDAFQARKNVEEFDLFTLDEVDRAFDMVTQLKYNQTVYLKGKGEGISITPLPAGHMLGGTIWKIIKDGEEDIIYAVDFNHKKEQHLNGCDIEKIQRPSLLITDAYNACYKQVRRRQRDEHLMTNILQTLRGNGNVLVCVDTAGRVLELAHMVDHLWQIQDSGLLAYSLALVNNVSYNVIEFAKSQIEWMSEKLMRTFEGKRNNPFQFRHLKLCHNMAEVNKVPSPKVVLASMPDLESGFSRELFQAWCTSSRNCVILTSRSPDGTLAQDLIKNGTDRQINITVKKRVKLTGADLEEHRRKEREEASKAARNSSLNQDPLLDDESSDEEMLIDPTTAALATAASSASGGGGAAIVAATTSSSSLKRKSAVKHDIVVRGEGGRQQTGTFKSIKTKYPMYPFHEEKVRWDDYGEIIRPEEWMDLSNDPSAAGENGSGEGRSALSGIVPGGTGDPNDDADVTEVPTKCVTSQQTFHVKCRVQFIDFEGRSDGDSIFKVVSAMKPRRTIVVRGKEENRKALGDFCRQVAAKMGDNVTQAKIVFFPMNGETVDATTESYIYQVRLPESLVSQLFFSKGKDGMLAWVDGIISKEQPEISDLSRPSDVAVGGEGEEKDEAHKPRIPSLLPLPDSHVRGHPSVFVNELKLSDFKLVLLRNGLPSEFIGGVLFCGPQSNVALRRHDSGRVTIEGIACEEYYKVRGLLYEQYAIV